MSITTLDKAARVFDFANANVENRGLVLCFDFNDSVGFAAGNRGHSVSGTLQGSVCATAAGVHGASPVKTVLFVMHSPTAHLNELSDLQAWAAGENIPLANVHLSALTSTMAAGLDDLAERDPAPMGEEANALALLSLAAGAQ